MNLELTRYAGVRDGPVQVRVDHGTFGRGNTDVVTTPSEHVTNPIFVLPQLDGVAVTPLNFS